MNNEIGNVDKKKARLIPKEEKPLFIKIEELEGRKIYHTKIMMDLYSFGIYTIKRYIFFISLRGLFDQDKIESFHLFSLKEDDKFLGIYYGYRKPIKNVVRRYEENGIEKSHSFSKAYYIEFRFKKGSVFCYMKGISRLVKKDKINTKYCKTLINMLATLEKEVYEFYGKKFLEGGIISKWIKKNLK
ncbi:DUF226 domain-containing protein (plasmid) [Borrelia miyamotoi]|uniref:DUF226 domain-containing protein n=1 Tax=Borrelia miyamotoi TaxID=47466 RepID=A0A5P8AUV0_9SPIR|nr:DUF226 domain-containing protein [Borrelia miyamotoi]QFP42504.1 DUF226 domain-containing protein [Borrelia miyamotoi]WAZ72537.1 DUF226 domain-containing protein [Borrelia miyamotoi]